MIGSRDAAIVKDLLRQAKALGAHYYRVTGKPLGVTGEVAELEAAEKLGLELCIARTPGFDAIDQASGSERRVQIKGRAVAFVDRYRGRCPSIKCGGIFDDVLLLLLDHETLDTIEIWKALEGRRSHRCRPVGSTGIEGAQRTVVSVHQSVQGFGGTSMARAPKR